MKRLLITGAKRFEDKHAIYCALTQAQRLLDTPSPEIILVHGGSRGAEELAAMIGHHMMMPIEAHQTNFTTHRNTASVVRNREMVARGADLCIGFPLKNAHETWDCLHQAAQAGIPTLQWRDNHITTDRIDEPGRTKARRLCNRRLNDELARLTDEIEDESELNRLTTKIKDELSFAC